MPFLCCRAVRGLIIFSALLTYIVRYSRGTDATSFFACRHGRHEKPPACSSPEPAIIFRVSRHFASQCAAGIFVAARVVAFCTSCCSVEPERELLPHRISIYSELFILELFQPCNRAPNRAASLILIHLALTPLHNPVQGETVALEQKGS